MTEKRIVTVAALALAATLLSALPAAAAPRAAPRAVQASPAGLVRQGLAWLAALWGGGRVRTVAAGAESVGGSSPKVGATAITISTRPAGGGIDPDGFF